MVVQHNLPAMNANRQLGINNAGTSKNLEKLSSGYKINKAGDDAAGLAISEKMRGQIRGLTMATTNAENGVSLIQTAEGGLNETHAILQRMRELAVQSANGTYADDVDRENIAKETEALKSEIDRIASSTAYNGIKLLDGSLGGEKVSKADSTELAATLVSMGFAAGTTIELVAANTATKDMEGAEATFNVREDGTVSLQIGDTTYNLATATAGSVTANQTFVDKDGNAVAELSDAYTAAASNTTGVFKVAELAAPGTASDALEDGDDNYIATDDSKLVFQIGANGSLDQRVGLHVDNMSSGNLGSEIDGYIKDIDVSTRESANDAIKVIDAATNQVSGTRADLGALQNRLEHTINNLGVTKENLQAAESSIRDVNMAEEMMEFTKNNILLQASQSMLAQSNQLPQGVLQLLR